MKSPRRTLALGGLTCAAALLFLATAVSAQQQTENARYRTGLESIASHEEIIVRVSEIEPNAPSNRVVVTFYDKKGRAIARRSGRVSSREPFEAILRAEEIGPENRELVRVDVRILKLSELNLPTVHVDFFDPFDLTFRGGPVCGPGAQAAGVIANCQNFLLTHSN